MENGADEKTVIILVLADAGYPEYYRTLFTKDKKVKIHTFQDSYDVVRHCHFDIILIDCTLDIEAGLDILRNNKAVCPHVPNIFITDIGYEGLVLNVFRSGARDFFRKPVDIFELKDTVNRLLEVKHESQELRIPAHQRYEYFLRT